MIEALSTGFGWVRLKESGRWRVPSAGFDVLLEGEGVALGRLQAGDRLIKARVEIVGACVRVEVHEQAPKEPGSGIGQPALLGQGEERGGVGRGQWMGAEPLRRCA